VEKIDSNTMESVQQFVDELVTKSTVVKDQRTQHLPLMDLWTMLGICASYVIFVLVGIPLAKSLPKMELKFLRVVHNSFLTVFNFYMCVEMLIQAHNTSWYGPLFRDERGLGMAKVIWLYYISKIVEFGDTAIMIFRHSFSQVSFLHVYHHVTVLMMWWFNALYYPGGEAYPSAFLNSFVHVWLYSYYLISSFGIDVWWKKYLTQLQISQLFLFVLQGISILFMSSDKEFRWIGALNGIYAFTLLALFVNFYVQNYNQKLKDAKKKNEKKKE